MASLHRRDLTLFYLGRLETSSSPEGPEALRLLLKNRSKCLMEDTENGPAKV
jgi:hypothetical protein